MGYIAVALWALGSLVLSQSTATNPFGHCILRGAEVHTPSGHVLIQDLRVGDQVLSLSSEGTVETSRIIKVRQHVTASYFEIRLTNRMVLRATGVHPVRVESRWISAKDLVVGDLVTTIHGQFEIDSIRVIDDTIAVYDLSVEPHQNFFASGVLVHNKSIY